MFTTLLTSQHDCCEKGPCQSINKLVKRKVCFVLFQCYSWSYTMLSNKYWQTLHVYSHIHIATYQYWSTGPLASLASPAIPVRGLLSLQRWARALFLFSITVLASVAKWFWMAPENVGGIIRKHVTIVALMTEAYS